MILACGMRHTAHGTRHTLPLRFLRCHCDIGVHTCLLRTIIIDWWEKKELNCPLVLAPDAKQQFDPVYGIPSLNCFLFKTAHATTLDLKLCFAPKHLRALV